MKPLVIVLLAVALEIARPSAQAPPGRSLGDLTRAYLWPKSAAELSEAERAIKADASLVGVARMQFQDFEEIARRGPGSYPMAPAFEARFPLQEIVVTVPGGASVPVLVQLPPRFSTDAEWPLMFAMHGGPPGRVEQLRAGAERMIKVWTEAAGRAGWIVAAPGMTPALTAGERTEKRLPYEVFHPEQAEAVIRALRARYPINPDRVVSTGISLGSNFSIAFACARPGWLAAIVPVSTEGDSRELLLRNLGATPVYILEGSKDKNIWGIGGPRALAEIVTSFGYDLTFREFADRAHEGFQDHYDDVLRWADGHPRQNYPREVLRVPHPAIMPVERRVNWIESDTRQGLLRARVLSPHRIDVTARFARELTVYLHDRLLDLDQPIGIWVNGEQVFAGKVARSIPFALEQMRLLGDERRGAAAMVKVKVPPAAASVTAGVKLSQELAQRRNEDTLSFWERFATGSLEERLPTVGFEGVETAVPAAAAPAPEQVAIRVTRVADGSAMAAAGLGVNDLILEVGGEPFFRGNGGVDGLRRWLMRELRGDARDYDVRVWRGGAARALTASLKLGPYAAPKTNAPGT
jgi:dienelactone hydrolase